MPLPAPLRRPAPIYPRRSKKSGGWYPERKEETGYGEKIHPPARARRSKRCAAERRKLARFLSKNGLNKEKNQVA